MNKQANERILIGVEWKRVEPKVSLDEQNLPTTEEETQQEQQAEEQQQNELSPTTPVIPSEEELNNAVDAEEDNEEEEGEEGDGEGSETAQEDSKINITLQSPTARYLHTCTLLNNNTQLVVFGGYTSSDIMNDTYVLSIEKDEWHEIPVSSSAPSIRYGHSAVEHNSKLYVFGGKNSDSYLNDLYEFDTVSQQWKQIIIQASDENSKLIGRAYHTACAYNDCLYIFGGSDDDTIFNELVQINLTTQQWKQLSAVENYNGPVARDQHSAVVNGNYMYVFGGVSEDVLDDFWQLHFPTLKWSKVKETSLLSSFRPTHRSGHVAGISGKNLIILGGEDPNTFKHFNDIYAFNIPNGEWIQVKQKANFIAAAHSKAAFNSTQNKIYLFGGYNSQMGPIDDFVIGLVKPIRRK
jgi:N-acetylneuraminic acid mutarotase